MNQAIERPVALYLEDLHVGQQFVSDSYCMEESRIKSFAEEFDPQPFHLDDAAARSTVFQGLSASGWHTAAVAMRLLVTGGLPLGNGIIGLGGELVLLILPDCMQPKLERIPGLPGHCEP